MTCTLPGYQLCSPTVESHRRACTWGCGRFWRLPVSALGHVGILFMFRQMQPSALTERLNLNAAFDGHVGGSRSSFYGFQIGSFRLTASN
jgi:hypothetical protein